MPVLYSNNAATALAASITSTATSFSVTSGKGALFPAIVGGDYFYATLISASDSNTLEVVKVTARSTDTFTVVRAQDGTTGTAFSAGDKVELRIVKAMLDDFKTDTRTGYLPLSGGTMTGNLVAPAINLNDQNGTVDSYWSIYGWDTQLQFTRRNSSGGYLSAPLTIDYSTSVVNAATNLTIAGNQALHAGNYTSYSPSLSGSGASGTWGINISGNSASTSQTTFSEVYSNGWLRNNNSGTGLYNQATANHFYSDGGYWNVGYAGTTGIRLRNGHAGTILGYLYAETNGNSGLLSNNGNWGVRLYPGGNGYLYGTWDVGRIAGPWTSGSRNYSNEWIEFGNYSGLYSPNNGAHFYPNDASYGAWRVAGSRNGYNGLSFNANNGQVTLMIHTNSNISGFHNQSYGWHTLWEGGTLYCFKNTYGGGTQATVWDSANLDWPSYGGVGSYVLAESTSLRGASGSWGAGTTVSGSSLVYCNTSSDLIASTMGGLYVWNDKFQSSARGNNFTNTSMGVGGTWRVMHPVRMGTGTGWNSTGVTALFVRIS